jgi:hypothetical protein
MMVELRVIEVESQLRDRLPTRLRSAARVDI